MKVLSLFDGMACGMIAMQLAGVTVESYDAYEIDKYAIKTAQHNFTMIKEHGDVFDADFTQYEGVDFLIGGSPCTYWSIAQTKNRETVASGMGWELFSQYVRALHEAKPKYFIYENNKSMSKQIRASIDDAFGFEAVLINSALVSAQNRQRLYWVGKRNEDGTYSKVNVEQPADRGILLKDVLDSEVAWKPMEQELQTVFNKDGGVVGILNMKAQDAIKRVYGYNGKAPTLTTCGGGHREPKIFSMVAELVCVAERGRMYCGQPQHYEARTDGKTNTLTSVEKDNRVAEPLQYEELSEEYYKGCADGNLVGMIENDGKYKNGKQPSQQYRVYSCEDKSVCVDADSRKYYLIPTMPVKEATSKGYTEIECGDCVDPSMPNSKTRRGRSMADKANCMQTSNDFYQYVGYAIEFDDDGRPIKAIGKDGKEITIYEVRDGKITIKGKQYPIKLKDGFYIIRKLTVSECKRLQTVPEWYEFPVSNSQAYKMLGNGWTCEVICHLINSCLKPSDALPGQIGLWG